MPRGKYLRKNKHNENALITRLMQISLKMDDHIYCGKLITAAEAGDFIKEVASLKLQCRPTNIRALQVIEKLTRCMRSILIEDTGHASYSFNNSLQMNTQFARSSSPVYSLPDDDKTVDFDVQSDVDETYNEQSNLTHKSHGQTNIVNVSKEQIYMPSSCLAQDNLNNLKNNTDDIEVIDITRDNETDETKLIVNKRQHISIEHVNSGLSNLTQDNLTNPKNNAVDIEIIDITNHNEIDETNLITNKQQHISIEHVNSGLANMRQDSVTNPKNNAVDIEIIDITNHNVTDKTDLIVNKEQHISIEHVNSGISNMAIQNEAVSETTDNNCSQSILDNYDSDSTNKVASNEKNTIVERNAYCETDAKAHVTKKVNNYFNKNTPLRTISTQATTIETPELVNSQVNVCYNVNSQSVTQSKTTVLKNKNKGESRKKTGGGKGDKAPAKGNSKSRVAIPQDYLHISKDVTKESDKRKPSKTAKKSRKNTKKNAHEIYNNNVENDLSWVENLRYVREIDPDENDPTLALLQDNFWDNFALPYTWNDSEFE